MIDAEARNDFWSIEGDCIYRYQTQLRVPLYMPTEESFPIPLKYIDVTRTTRTNLDVLERRCGSKFVRFMDRIQEVHFVERDTSQRISATARPGCLWLEIWSGVSKAAKKQEKQ